MSLKQRLAAVLIWSWPVLFWLSPMSVAQEPQKQESARVETAADKAAAPETAAADAPVDSDYDVQGEYLTAVQPDAGTGIVKGVQVVAQGDGLFRIVIYTGGLPGAGWNGTVPQIVDEEDATGVEELLKGMRAAKTVRVSPTMGAAPPHGAMVLFDGTADSLSHHWAPGAKLTSGNLLASGAKTIELFQDYRLHLEFRIPFMPEARGQARGNSGVYHQGRYETQVLDSFGLEGANNETGAIYGVRKPDVNVCFPPMVWQTYDIDFTAARFDSAGKKLSDARLTVQLNGVIVQRDVTVANVTRAAPLKEGATGGPLYLQDHGNPVEYRNIWILPRDADQEARRPRIVGFERFQSTEAPSIDGGLVLLGELGCVNCHQADQAQQRDILNKQSPILSAVGGRVRAEWMAKFLTDPHGYKAGTTMPDLLSGMSEADRDETVTALTQFLASTGVLKDSNPDQKKAIAGKKLFETVGCLACHAPLEGSSLPQVTSVPLGDLSAKYSISSLAQFLREPHVSRPSLRMPSLHLNVTEAELIANALLVNGLEALKPNVRYQVYYGRWEELPDFDQLKPDKEGTCVGFDLSVAGRADNFGIRFDAFLPDQHRGAYVFALGSDDGARISLDGDVILETPGIHPVQMKERTARFEERPVHTIRVDYFEAKGEEDLVVMFGRQGSPLEYLADYLVLTEDAARKPASAGEVAQRNKLTPDADLIAKGQKAFTTLGCANCHQVKQGEKALASSYSAKPLSALRLSGGCLEAGSTPVSAGVPRFELTSHQVAHLKLALEGLQSSIKRTPQQKIHQTLTSMNCLACHDRQGIGGPESVRNELFISTQPEMGDEGRLPPTLNGIGDKLQDQWLKTVLDKGARTRPYMLTRMPAFGGANTGHLLKPLIDADRRTGEQLATFSEPEIRVKSTGRHLVGNGGLGCIKCHTFGDKKSSGIQAISMTEMTSRLREDWFLRYVYDPQKYRPGTRMPTGFPNGEAVVKDVYHGSNQQQISAIWKYLSDGNKAGLPDGLVAQLIELKPEKEPIIYRNFIQGVSPRAIAVGYPEKVNLAWDANDLCLKLIWHNRFLDAAMHWSGRGTGSQAPLGDHVLNFEPQIPFAVLANRDTAWPTQSPWQQPGFQFQGYQLDELGRPTFRYQTPFGKIEDKLIPVAKNQQEGAFRRQLTWIPDKGAISETAGAVYFRAAVGTDIEQIENGFKVDKSLTIRVSGGDQPILRKQGDRVEVLVPLQSTAGGAVVVSQEIDW
ncbi:family 16 glycoside hydrolase [Planctomicrobium sp. SH527]|uniref:family 16 glycoside hydrolase n=1 Tax=Planctomicrobium sp. SH527 TaxID=3448123 RepID=UPI003F5AE2B0